MEEISSYSFGLNFTTLHKSMNLFDSDTVKIYLYFDQYNLQITMHFIFVLLNVHWIQSQIILKVRGFLNEVVLCRKMRKQVMIMKNCMTDEVDT